MSIKQNGGVFGRNPTFNDVTIEGQLTFDGDIDINSDLKIDGDLEVTGDATVKDLYITDISPTLRFTDTDGNNLANLTQAGTHFYFDNDSTGSIRMRVDGNTERFTVNHTGVDVNGTATIDQDASAVGLKVTGGNGGVNVAEFSRDIGADATVGINGNGGDPQIYFQAVGNTFAIGTNSTVFEIADNGSIGTNTRFAISSVGDVSISTGNFIIATTSTPASATASGTTGTIAWDSSYVYVCTATNTWKRTAISTW